MCGKVVRDMRKHRLIHTGEKPFQCDRCSYRCARSSSLKRHLATHLNTPSAIAHQQHQPPQQQSNIVQSPDSVEEGKFHLNLPAPSLPTVSVALPQAAHDGLHMQPQEALHPEHHDHLGQVAYDPNSIHYRTMKFS